MRRRFATLDAMRGVAAIVVLFYHSQGLYGPACTVTGTCNVRFGYLAVDMFFALSGFVLSYRYDGPLAGSLNFLGFMRLRFIRLMPLYWIGAAIGAAGLAMDLLHGAPRSSTMKVVLSNALILPSPTFHTHIDPFPINSPAWSLFFEFYIANVIFALCHRHLRGSAMMLLLAVAFSGLVAVELVYRTIDVGSLWATFAGGFPRVIFSFFVGVVVQRIHARRPSASLPAFAILFLLICSFVIRVPAWASPIYELACVSFLYPALIYLGASAIEHRPLVGKMLGDASYALYVVHIPILLLINRSMATFGFLPSWQLAISFAIGVIVLALTIDFVYDRRAHALLGRVLLPRSVNAGPVSP